MLAISNALAWLYKNIFLKLHLLKNADYEEVNWLFRKEALSFL